MKDKQTLVRTQVHASVNQLNRMSLRLENEQQLLTQMIAGSED